MEKTVSVLVVVDMQKDFVDGALGTPEAVAIVPAVCEKIEAYKKAGGVIIATRDTHTEDYMNTQEGKNLPVPHCIKGTPGWEINAAVAAALPEGCLVLDKPTFGSLRLAEEIGTLVKEYGEKNVKVEVIGLCTDICVISNALLLKANFTEMPVSLDRACCAGVTPASHDAAILAMKMCQVAVKE